MNTVAMAIGYAVIAAGTLVALLRVSEWALKGILSGCGIWGDFLVFIMCRKGFERWRAIEQAKGEREHYLDA